MDLSTYNSFADSWWPYIIAVIFGTIMFIRAYVGGHDCSCDNKINGKIVLITGASSGMGLYLAKDLAKRGGKLILTCRNLQKGRDARVAIRKQTPNAYIDLKQLDVSSLKNIKEFVQGLEEYKRIDILINNAGVMLHPYEITSEGFEIHFVTNYLGHFLLTHLLMPKLIESENGRIINITAQSYAAENINLNDFNLKDLGSNQIMSAFKQSKLALVLMTRYMAKLLKDTKVTINAADPGLVRNTDHMNRSPLKISLPVRLSVWPWMWLFLKSPKQGCQTTIYLAINPHLNDTSGKLYSNCEAKTLAENCKNEKVDAELYKLSCLLTNVNPIN